MTALSRTQKRVLGKLAQSGTLHYGELPTGCGRALVVLERASLATRREGFWTATHRGCLVAEALETLAELEKKPLSEEETMEPKKEGRLQLCTRCKQKGHNARNPKCPGRTSPPPSKPENLPPAPAPVMQVAEPSKKPNSKLKRKVRAIRSRTGEKYTAALAGLKAERTPPAE